MQRWASSPVQSTKELLRRPTGLEMSPAGRHIEAVIRVQEGRTTLNRTLLKSLGLARIGLDATFAPPRPGAVDMKTLEFDLDPVLDAEADYDDQDHDLDSAVESRKVAKKVAGKGAAKAPRKALTMSKNSNTGKGLQVMDTMVPTSRRSTVSPFCLPKRRWIWRNSITTKKTSMRPES
jgi:hypothetical protein